MCGIAGIINKDSKIEIQISALKKMADKIKHRGPDAEGFHIDQNVGLAHRRLSIIDVSSAADQPFYFEEKYILIFNGAIYNHIEIREELIKLGYKFKMQSDTEVLIASYDCWGEDCVNKFNGMWAFAILDKVKNIVFCSRDRFGIKPFYYYSDEKKFIFSSEIKPILEIQPINKVNTKVLLQYLIINISDISEETFFEKILKLPGSHNLIYDLKMGEYSIYRYYDLKFKKEISILNLDDSIKLFHNEFEKSIKLRLRSDVKIASALSGGLDSSYMVAMAKKNIENVDGKDTFTAITVGSLNKEEDESSAAKIIASTLGVNHDIVIPSIEEFKDSLDDVIYSIEEPFGGPSIYMQKFLMKEARSLGTKVLLDGQGADEILLGYSRYAATYLRRNGLMKKIKFLRNVKSHYDISAIEAIKIYFYYSTFIIRKIFLLNRAKFLKKIYKDKLDFSKIKDLTQSYKNTFELHKNEIFWCQLPELLKWEDKNAMQHGIESRLPFLDYNFVETCLSINNNFKIQDGWSKYLLRRNLENYLPNSITYNRRKIGFNAPIQEWWPESMEIINTINKSTIIRKLVKKDFKIIKDRDLEWRLYNIAVWEKMYNMKIED
ncbi:asparagine synthase (glutamine-hydrolyzing) [Paenimyroides baculatum]|uniref:asparagine synthase (glutamine-hydrolyzing) n=1 Tax=Paenimyroides baculatum TaxID=2608000 RepID=A0A5M6CK37_9FLAO|nr:asparagine synthase (glutamine-hydrolyzing) [Paenimyroides baculatum]KAA5535383.1 asparagine synthase (glutamine-hydrolyzing) [Paenimyroides baculatum]